MRVKLVCDTDIRGVCFVMRTTCGRRGYIISHIILGFLGTMIFNGSLSFERWVEIQGLQGLGLVVLRLEGEYL